MKGKFRDTKAIAHEVAQFGLGTPDAGVRYEPIKKGRKLMPRNVWIFLLSCTLLPTGCQPPARQSDTDGIAHGDRRQAKCNLATIYRLSENEKIDVRENPDANSRSVRRLSEGDIIYTCDDFGDWVNVYFSGTEAPCFRAYDGGLEEGEARKCSSGWVQEKWVNTLSG